MILRVCRIPPMLTRQSFPARRRRRFVLVVVLVTIAAAVTAAFVIPGLRRTPAFGVELGARSISKAPFLIAADQGLFAKYGVEVDLRMPPPDRGVGLGERSRVSRLLDVLLRRPFNRIGFSNGATPDIVEFATSLRRPPFSILASTDCIIRSHIVGRHGITSLEQLKGKRIGVTTYLHNLTGVTAEELARRMGWDPVQDVSIIRDGDKVEMLRDGRVDAIVAQERDYAEALEEGFPILLDTREWGDLPIGGNSLQISKRWLEDPAHRDTARRFLQALVEGVALFHEDRELALDVLQRWNGVTRRYAEVMYDRAAIPRVPYPCYDGIRRTMALYDSHAMRALKPEDFYDDSLLRELEASGFVDGVYAAVRARRAAPAP